MYVLLFLVMINGHTDRYVIDHGLTFSDCVRVARDTEVTDKTYTNVRIHTEYRCVKAR